MSNATQTTDLATLRAAAYAAYNDHVSDMQRDPIYRAVATAAEREQERVIARLTYLGNVLVKYAHRWNDDPSARMLAWVDEYNELRRTEPATFRAYCDRYGFGRDHNAYDCLA